jgi:predicted nucleotidyltransferase
MARSILADIDRLRRHVEPHVRRARKVIAFGSVARGDADEWSDLHLIIVAETARPFFERFKDFRGLYDVWPRLDLLIYTPAEFEQMLADENPLIAAAVAEGIVLHEAAES